MGVIIGTASKVTDKFGSGRHGFTGGNAEAGVFPTELSADWHDAAAEEVNNLIADVGYDTPSALDYAQLSQALDYSHFAIYPRRSNWGYQFFRSELTSLLPVASASSWLVRRRTASIYAAADNSSQTFCSMTSVPNDSQFWVTFHALIVQRDSLTTYNHVVLRCSCRKSGGTVTVQKTTTVDSDSAGLVVTWSCVNSSGGPAIRAVLPVAAGKTFNLFAYGEVVNLIRV